MSKGKMGTPPNDKRLTDAEKEVVADEASGTEREAERQAGIERERVFDAAREAAREAAKEDTAPAAKETFWTKMHNFITGNVL